MKKIHLTDSYALINFDAIDCSLQADVLQSNTFLQVVLNFMKCIGTRNCNLVDGIEGLEASDIIDFYKLLLVDNLDDAIKKHPNIEDRHIKPLYNFTEELYDYWRNLERFGLVKGSKNHNPNTKVNDLIAVGSDFNEMIITLYRTIIQKLLKDTFNIYRQLPAGINANMLYIKHSYELGSEFNVIQNVPFVVKVVTSPPFIIKSKNNTRSGLFTEIKENPIAKLNIVKSNYVAFPIYVGPLLSFVYIHRDFLHHGIALSNLFEFARYEDFKNKKPDLIVFYGVDKTIYDCKYYIDRDTDTYVGFVDRTDENDYFGYLKKILLTLHNVYMINRGSLPIHGAMVKILLNNNDIKNVAIIGDSGAGKSETLEALRVVGGETIKNMDVIFDDMGTFKLDNNNVVANGTETGAFVRLDDLDTGYAYEIMDRALFLNPNKVNARVVIPMSSYELISSNHKIDYLFYANNYDKTKAGIRLFDKVDEALETFEKGVRFAKGTTTETGLVETYFANPFGPVQLRTQTEPLVKDYFNKLKDDGTVIGEIYTKLGVSGYESAGPKEAATALLDYITGGKHKETL